MKPNIIKWQWLLNVPVYKWAASWENRIFAYAKTKGADQHSAFVSATWIVQFLFFLNPKFPASSLLVWLYRLVCTVLVGNPEDRFSHVAAQKFSI